MTLELTFMGNLLAQHSLAKRSTMPVCIDVHHIGVHPESEYDEFGETAPATWICVCGGRLKSARLEQVCEYVHGCYVERDEWDYVAVSDARRDEFWAAHRPCETAVLELAAETGAAAWEVCSDLRSWTLTEERRYHKTGEFAEVDKTEAAGMARRDVAILTAYAHDPSMGIHVDAAWRETVFAALMAENGK